ncbi:MAG: hypothetical protein ABI707_14685 [Ferruginibacter sp.]
MKFSSSFIATVLFLSFIATFFSCYRNNNSITEDVVYYYPEKNTYYDSLQSNYYYSLDGAKTWDSMAFNTTGFGAALGPRVSIERMEDSVWAHNESHRKKYKGVLLNVITSRTIALLKADRINKLKAIVKRETQPVVIEKKDTVAEKGLKKFFHKLFGKKKKPAEEKKQ